MALTHHDDLEFIAGDDWTITGLLLDLNGSALDLTNATFDWTLIDPTGSQIAAIENGTTIRVCDPPTIGMVTITVPAALTENLLAGRYHDALRVFVGVRSTYWMGTILVACDPFMLLPSSWPSLQVVNFDAVPLLTAPSELDEPT